MSGIVKRQLGASTLQVSNVCLGTMTFGEQNTEAEAHSQLDYALERGIHFIDTAEMQ
jgi:aryl-alcohol dehydrogenase-like predicted oxidoreductase